MNKKAIFPGSFDPFTIGHYDIVVRALDLFDQITIGIGKNNIKQPTFTLDERLAMIQHTFANEPRIQVVAYDGLTVDFAKQQQALFILRGVRSVQDFEYERNIAEANRQLTGIDTVLLYTRPEYAHISSSLLKDLYAHGRDITSMLPPMINI
jgi:pantetheine-phosphate adenylyltransferase